MKVLTKFLLEKIQSKYGLEKVYYKELKMYLMYIHRFPKPVAIKIIRDLYKKGYLIREGALKNQSYRINQKKVEEICLQ